MSHSLTKIWVHATFSTKDRVPLLKDHFSDQIYEHINGRLSGLGCDVRIISGTEDHSHILFLLSPDKYAAFSVSESNVEGVENYIRRQEEHHRRMTFQEEYERFVERYGLGVNR